jgi:putative transposase
VGTAPAADPEAPLTTDLPSPLAAGMIPPPDPNAPPMFRSQKLLLKPTLEQERLFRGSAGLSRFAWNWAVALLKRHYELFGRGSDGKRRKGYRRPSAFTLGTFWNRIKDRRFPWVRKYSQLIPKGSFRKVELAYEAAFAAMKRTGRWNPPRFHKKGVKESFCVSSGATDKLARQGQRFSIPRVGFVKCVTPIRWPDSKRLTARIKLVAGRWWLFIAYDLPDPKPLPKRRPPCGVDLGCTTFATVASMGIITEELAPPKPFSKAKKKLRRLQRRLSRRVKGSKRKAKARLAVAKAHQRVGNIRDNFLHQLSAKLVKTYGTIVLEDLCVAGMARGFLSGTIHDMGFYEFRRQVEYKAEAAGTKVVFADRFFPSSKMCHACGFVRKELELSERVLWCRCGEIIDRDHNAALNLEKLGRRSPEVTPVETGGSGGRKASGAGRRSGNHSRGNAR